MCIRDSTIGDRKTALFVIISDTDDTFNFVVSILYTQLFNLLCEMCIRDRPTSATKKPKQNRSCALVSTERKSLNARCQS